MNSTRCEGGSIAGDDVINFLPGAVIIGDPRESVEVAALEPRAQNGPAMRRTECEQTERVVVW